MKRKTRRGGFFNFKKAKSLKKNIKDWFLYWRHKHPYYPMIRYPGYYNFGLEPVNFNRTSLFHSNIDHVTGCEDALTTTNNINFLNKIQQQKFEKCGANLTGENKKYYNLFWKCKFPKFDEDVNWVDLSTHNLNNCKSDSRVVVNRDGVFHDHNLYYDPVYHDEDLLPIEEDLKTVRLTAGNKKRTRKAHVKK
jgi:hypothetical protein